MGVERASAHAHAHAHVCVCVCVCVCVYLLTSCTPKRPYVSQHKEQMVEAMAQGRYTGVESRVRIIMDMEERGTMNMMMLRATAVPLCVCVCVCVCVCLYSENDQ